MSEVRFVKLVEKLLPSADYENVMHYARLLHFIIEWIDNFDRFVFRQFFLYVPQARI